MIAPRQIKLALMMQETGGVHPASWLHPKAKLGAANDIDYYRTMAQTAEKALFDLFFIADTPAARIDDLHAWSRYPLFMNVFEPTTLLAAVAGSTSRIGLGATSTTTYNEPYNVARQFASLDHISHGRAGWNVVTSANKYVAPNFGEPDLPPHAERYARARDFVHLVQKLWDSWEDDAFIRDRASGRYFDPSKLHPIHHQGTHFKLDGALNIARTPQGQPVIIQAGASEVGRELAAETAELVFGTATTLDDAKAFYGDLKKRMAKFGRSPDAMRILTGCGVMLGESAEEAEAKYLELQNLVHPDVGRFFLSNDLETDLSDLPLDEPIPKERLPTTAKYHRAYFEQIIATIERDNPTLRQLYLSYERGRKTFKGTSAQVADLMQEWFEGEGADGFMMIFPLLPSCLEEFTAGVVPELQRRGLFRTAYEGMTLRENLGLPRPANRFAAKPAELAAE
ncbi:FMN-dependent oxidoreductase, nitrilotriacetate monooxygenase family [Arboricoccus pini]|uniref:FMN-dependent oxidoreductase, nitrilotriacetate monooxygenase family n=1 Tax=Arboricoccus pini TaxID=1963835 RepID=A0A212RJR5_9PROT|nr:LLM class flavin-dependent oxidoreductase [Arboricoccus pini]SNB72517.1 FMN-dependent oxidoreductase, nitrilotriacetate monooxygenase family [Arboricoccus pini]